MRSATDDNISYEFLCDDWFTENSHETVLYGSEEMQPPSRPRSTKSMISNGALAATDSVEHTTSRSQSRQSKTSVQVKDRSSSRQSHGSAAAATADELNKSSVGDLSLKDDKVDSSSSDSSDSEESSEQVLKIEKAASSRASSKQSNKSEKLVVEKDRSRKSSRRSSPETRSASKNSLTSVDDSDGSDSDATLQADNDNQSLHSAKSEKSLHSAKSEKSQKSAHSVLEQLARKFSVKSGNSSEGVKSGKSSRAASAAGSNKVDAEENEADRPVSKQSVKSKQSNASTKKVFECD